MLQLHEHQRRSICRVLFLGLSIVPTMAMLAWAVSVRLPGHVAAYERELAQSLGVDARLGGVTHPSPEVTLLHDVELTDPESGAPVLRARLLELDQQGNRLAITASQPEIQAEQLPALRELLRRCLILRTAASPDIRLIAQETTVHWSDTSRTFTDVQAQIESGPVNTQAAVSFRIAGIDMPEPARVRVVRDRQTKPPSFGFELHTGGALLPCSMLLAPLELQNRLGEQAQFQGALWAARSSDGWKGQVTEGKLTEVDLGTLVSEQFPHRLSGPAQLAIDHAIFVQGRLHAAAGTLTAGPGVIGRSLVQAAANGLQMEQTQIPDAAARYDQLAIGFAVDAAGLTLKGKCRSAGPGTVAAMGDVALLKEFTAPVPVVSLVRTLVPQNEVQAPATRETDWLTRFLPLPPAITPASNAPQAGHSRLRIAQ